jgi:hypothetical protein
MPGLRQRKNLKKNLYLCLEGLGGWRVLVWRKPGGVLHHQHLRRLALTGRGPVHSERKASYDRPAVQLPDDHFSSTAGNHFGSTVGQSFNATQPTIDDLTNDYLGLPQE